jgi:hypothetical protein
VVVELMETTMRLISAWYQSAVILLSATPGTGFSSLASWYP